MSVLLNRNDTTELNVISGAEATIRSQKSSTLADGWPILDVIFVELKNPPTPMKLRGLPLDTVPICRAKQSLYVGFSNKHLLGVNRDQIPLLPNFAMTDYAS